MSNVTIAPLPGGLGGELTDTEISEGVAAIRFGRHQILAVLTGLVGILLVAAVAPNLSDAEKSLAFEPPPDPVQVTFHPPTVVTAIGVLWIVAAVVTLLPVRLGKAALVLQVLAAVSVIPLILVVALALSESPSTNVTVLFQQSLVLATPLALGAMTGLWCERSGIVNIGIEGMMLASAGVGYMSYAVLGDAAGGVWLWIALLVAVVVGGLFGALHAWLSIQFQINQIVAGVVINLVALGLTSFLRSEVIVPSGFSKGQGTTVVALPLLSDIPIVGDTIFTGGPLHFAMYAIVFVTWLVMYRTPWGLRVRSCGERPHAAETVGLNVPRMRYQAVILGGLIAGVAGAWFSLEGSGQGAGFEDNMTNSAGFIALAALIVGKWTPWGAFGGALLFGFARALGSRLQFLGVSIGGFEIPSEFFQALPYIVTLVVVAGALGRSVAPAAEGQPFTPSK
jgi:simple sugar transport system permease protein